MTKEEKVDYINKRCDAIYACIYCPIKQYMSENDIEYCLDIPIDKQYELLMGA